MNFEMKKLQKNCPVMIAKIPDLIMKEVDIWVEESKKIKDHPLAELKAHEMLDILLQMVKNTIPTKHQFHLI